MKKIITLLAAVAIALSASAKVRQIAANANLKKVIVNSLAGDTLLLATGLYTVEGGMNIDKPLVIKAAEGAKPVISISTFNLGLGVKWFALEGLDLTMNHKYLFAINRNSEATIGTVAIKNCTVNVGGAEGASLFISASAEATNSVSEFVIDNSIIHNAGFPMATVFNCSNSATTTLGKLIIENSTISNITRGLIVTAQPTPIEVVIRNTTCYNLNTTESTTGTIRTASATKLTVENSLFTFATARIRFAVLGEGSTVSVTNSYYTNEAERVGNTEGLKALGTPASALYTAPVNDPTETGASFAIKNSVVQKPCGDPRW